ncbi:MAG: F0F1 ATP synthase subunit epsilon [Microthrixaceae bacterium]|nr:F0F1 ATP synthase subunit epsilon [Microthrixaceae bacterium]
MALQVELVSPERIAYSGEAKEVIARVVTGDIAFLTGHVPYLGILQSAPVRVLFEDGTELPIAVHQGFVQVADDTVTILSDVCELPDQIDIRRAEAAKAKAEEALRADVGDSEAQDALRRAQTRISVATGTVAGARH